MLLKTDKCKGNPVEMFSSKEN